MRLAHQVQCGCGAWCYVAISESGEGSFLVDRTGVFRTVKVRSDGIHVVVPILQDHICKPPAPITAPTAVALGGASLIADDDVGVQPLVDWAGEEVA